MIQPRIRDAVTDQALPQLRELTDLPMMRQHFEQALKLSHGRSIAECRIIRVRYRPGRNCTVSYRLSFAESESAQSDTAIISLLACLPGESRARFINAQSAATTQPDLILHLPAIEAVAWIFPQDRKLPGLARLADRALLKEHLLPEIINSPGPGLSITSFSIEPISYMAERACTLRISVELSATDSARTETRNFYVKTLTPDEGIHAWHNWQRLWHSEEVQRGRLLIPQPVAYQTAACALWHSELAGHSLIDDLHQPDSFLRLMKEAGTVIARLHQTNLTGLSAITPDETIAQLGAAAFLLSQVRPECRADVQELVRLLISKLPRPEAPTATLHGDLHLKNLLVTADGVALIDLDNLCAGDPAREIGSLTAMLYHQFLTNRISQQMAEQSAEQFVAGWQQGSKRELSESALHWHTAAALIYERAVRCIIRLSDERVTMLDDLIALARQMASKL
ncbi:MAG: aminoglycoside phosphotransferase family protein [Blastocatellia bacterium]